MEKQLRLTVLRTLLADAIKAKDTLMQKYFESKIIDVENCYKVKN